MREEKIIELLEKFKNDSMVNNIKACKEQIEYNESMPKKSSEFMQRLHDEQTEALRKLLKELSK